MADQIMKFRLTAAFDLKDRSSAEVLRFRQAVEEATKLMSEWGFSKIEWSDRVERGKSGS